MVSTPVELYPFVSSGLFAKEGIHATGETLTFDGYFRIEPELFPIRRLLILGDVVQLIEITKKEVLADTSEYEHDEEEGVDICFTPTQRIRLTYAVLRTIPKGEDITALLKDIDVASAAEQGASIPIRIARDWAIWEEQVEALNYS
jgi:hypothetical protein